MRRSPRLLIPAQAAAAVIALSALALYPPSSGRLLLIPLMAGDANAVAAIAVSGGAALLGSGPLPGSLVVIGDRSAIARRIGSAAIVITAAPPAGCGGNVGGSPAA